MPKSKKIFFYCFPANDYYFAALVARSIHYCLTHYPDARHVVYPIYGARIYSSLRSRFPRWIKRVHALIVFLRSEASLEKTSRNSLHRWLRHDQIKQLEIITFWQWITSLALESAHSLPQLTISADDFIGSFRLQKILSGDLVVDTFLRFKGVPQVDLKHWFVRDIIWRARAIERLTAPYLKGSQQLFYFGSYSTYINHGITLRLACSNPNGISITYGSVTKGYQIHKGLNDNYLPTHAGYHQFYSVEKAMSLSPDLLKAAEASLRGRVLGTYDSSMSYMSKNDLNNSLPQNQSKQSFKARGNVILMLHDFFDSPHIYQCMLFPDFWDWANQTIEFCATNQISLLVKPHPNQLPENEEVIAKLRIKFQSCQCIQWLKKETLNAQIFSEEPRAIVSAYGSVAAEAAYWQIPVLMAGDHPGINFKIAKVAGTKEEYFHLLANINQIPKGNRTEAILFTAIHHQKNLDPSSKPTLISELGGSLNMINANPALLTTPKAIQKIDELIEEVGINTF